MSSMITALTWVPRGAARERPVRFELSEEEYGRIKHLAALEEAGEADAMEARKGVLDSDSDSDSNRSNAEERNIGDLPAEYNMDAYDDEEVEDFAAPKRGAQNGGAFGNDTADEEDNLVDSVTLMENHGVALAIDGDSEDEDADDDQISPTDSLLVVALTEEEHSHLEVQLLSEDGSIYTHHDIALPEFPLCVAWTDCPPYTDSEGAKEGNGTYLTSSSAAEAAASETLEGQKSVGNYIAVGTFQSGIEIWNLDVLDPIEPAAVLGGAMQDEELEAYRRAQLKSSKKASKGKGNAGGKGKGSKTRNAEDLDLEQNEEQPIFREGSHTDAVMCLSWNSEYRQLLASGSADKTVKVWDMTTRSCSHTFTHHTDKVQCVLWHPTESHVLATGGFDRKVYLADCRSGNVIPGAEYDLPADIESMVWDPHCPQLLYVSCEDGCVLAIDVRKTGTHLAQWQAHAKTCTAVSCSVALEGFFVTASIDKTVRVWDTSSLHQAATGEASSTTKAGKGKSKKASAYVSKVPAPKLIAQKKLNAGKLFAMSCYADSPFVVAAGGDKGSVAVWLSDEWEPIRSHFANRNKSDTKTDVLTAVVGSAGSQIYEEDREPTFATHGSDEDSDASGDEMDDDTSDESDQQDDAGMDEDYEDESWMDDKAPAPKPTKKATTKKKGKGKK